MPNTRISSGVISDPPPIPVVPTRMPTPSPKTISQGSISDVQAALGLGEAGPAALAAVARRGARRAADRVVALVVQRVVGQVALVDALPDVLLGPVDQRVVLPQLPLLVPLDGLGVRARGRLLAPDAGDPGVRAGQRALQRRHLGLAAALRRAPGPVGLL